MADAGGAASGAAQGAAAGSVLGPIGTFAGAVLGGLGGLGLGSDSPAGPAISGNVHFGDVTFAGKTSKWTAPIIVGVVAIIALVWLLLRRPASKSRKS